MRKEVREGVEKEFRNLKEVDRIRWCSDEGLCGIDMGYRCDGKMKEAEGEVEKISGKMNLGKEIRKGVVSELNSSMIGVGQITIQKE
ncbi:hypothetical protein, partial [Bacillus mycoides]|uniref:hypothetical protein n=1 Tax=Bacillus mycoides TaxID=1405 RepID=UPI0011AA7477